MRDIGVSLFTAAIFLAASTVFRIFPAVILLPSSKVEGHVHWFAVYFLVMAAPAFLAAVPAAMVYRVWSPPYHPRIATLVVFAICILTTLALLRSVGPQTGPDKDEVLMVVIYLTGVYLFSALGVRIIDRSPYAPRNAA